MYILSFRTVGIHFIFLALKPLSWIWSQVANSSKFNHEFYMFYTIGWDHCATRMKDPGVYNTRLGFSACRYKNLLSFLKRISWMQVATTTQRKKSPLPLCNCDMDIIHTKDINTHIHMYVQTQGYEHHYTPICITCSHAYHQLNT